MILLTDGVENCDDESAADINEIYDLVEESGVRIVTIALG
jgi:hypothetical protein